jgi:hypothetical protein
MNDQARWDSNTLAGVDSILRDFWISSEELVNAANVRRNPFADILTKSAEIGIRIRGQIDLNLRSRVSERPIDVGRLNWKLRLSPKEKPAERTEKYHARRYAAMHPPPVRGNEMPTCSGLLKDTDQGRRIDIVERLSPDNSSYRFIELKTNLGTNSPGFAAVEILLYALIYLHCRKHWKHVYNSMPVMGTKLIELVVMAPSGYFAPYAGIGIFRDASEFVAAAANAAAVADEIDVEFRFHWMTLDLDTLDTSVMQLE